MRLVCFYVKIVYQLQVKLGPNRQRVTPNMYSATARGATTAAYYKHTGYVPQTGTRLNVTDDYERVSCILDTTAQH